MNLFLRRKRRRDSASSRKKAKRRRRYFTAFKTFKPLAIQEKLKEAKKIVPTPPINRGSSEKVVSVQPQRKQRHSESAPSSISFDSLDNLLNEGITTSWVNLDVDVWPLDLSYVLCEENENILKHKKVPAFPATATIEHILNDVMYSYIAVINIHFSSCG